MGDFPDGSILVEAISGKWYRFPPGFRKGTFLLDLSDEILLDVHMTSERMDIYAKDENGVFQCIGDITLFLDDDGLPTLHLFSTSIKQVHFHDKKHVISNELAQITSVMVNMEHSQRAKWEEKIKRKSL